jgi:hypothetical protein
MLRNNALRSRPYHFHDLVKLPGRNGAVVSRVDNDERHRVLPRLLAAQEAKVVGLTADCGINVDARDTGTKLSRGSQQNGIANDGDCYRDRDP